MAIALYFMYWNFGRVHQTTLRLGFGALRKSSGCLDRAMRPIPFRLFSRLRVSIARLWGWSPFGRGGHSADPRAGVRVPKRSGPGGRNSAVALMEPYEARNDVNAVGKAHGK